MKNVQYASKMDVSVMWSNNCETESKMLTVEPKQKTYTVG